jgi:hypothetical protein
MKMIFHVQGWAELCSLLSFDDRCVVCGNGAEEAVVFADAFFNNGQSKFEVRGCLIGQSLGLVDEGNVIADFGLVDLGAEAFGMGHGPVQGV